MPQTTVDVPALFAAIDAKRRKDRSSWREIAAQLRISPSTFTRLAQGRRPDVDTFATLLAWLGEPVESFSRAAPPLPATAQIATVSLFFRADKSLRDTDLQAYEDVIEAASRALEE
jgi:transcriptional regulator with XRE-family HTH domain